VTHVPVICLSEKQGERRRICRKIIWAAARRCGRFSGVYDVDVGTVAAVERPLVGPATTTSDGPLGGDVPPTWASMKGVPYLNPAANQKVGQGSARASDVEELLFLRFTSTRPS